MAGSEPKNKILFEKHILNLLFYLLLSQTGTPPKLLLGRNRNRSYF
jgi:hypothetical protein